MKTRKGFVSNSSSSSFILGVSPNAGEIKIQISIENEIEHRLKTIEEIQKYFLGEWSWGEVDTWEKLIEEEGDWLTKRYQKMVSEIEKGNIVIVGTASSEGDSTAGLAIYYGALAELNDPNITIIDDGEC